MYLLSYVDPSATARINFQSERMSAKQGTEFTISGFEWRVSLNQ